MKLIHNSQNLNNFPHIPSGFKEISVFDNNITKVPIEVWETQGLEVLNISANKINHLSPQIDKLINSQNA